MSTLDELEVGCGRTLNHAETCGMKRLCDSCIERIKAYIFQTNLTSAVSAIRSHTRLWKTSSNHRVKRLQAALDDLCSFIEDET
jgi:7-keto-8-aminopelargonate synthetase-like enzyme